MTPDMTLALKLIYATVLTNDLQGEPLWIHVVGPPGCGKTELLQSTEFCSQTVIVSRITQNALVSGWKAAEDPSLLPKLLGRVFILKDFTEVLSMPAAAKDDIYSTLRGAYDGYVCKPFGHGVVREYHGTFSMLTGVTHEIYAEQGASLGERFLKYHLMRGVGTNVDDLIRNAVRNVGIETDMHTALSGAAKAFLDVRVSSEDVPALETDLIERIVQLCQVVAMLRANVGKDFQERVIHRPDHEIGTRLAKQFAKLIVGMALLRGGNGRPAYVDETDYEVLKRIARDTCIGYNLSLIHI